MDAIVKKDTKDMLAVELAGDNRTISNLLREELWNDSTVTLAAYEKKHPYIGNPVLLVKGKDPGKSLKGAIKRVQENLSDFEKQFAKATK